jgi:site-specific DNA recombinase
VEHRHPAEKLGCYAITQRLNADPGRYPPPRGGWWIEPTIYAILRNPKYTGHMVFGRRRTTPAGRSVPVPEDQWLWCPEPAHPPIITRATFDAAQAIGAEHSTSRDDPVMNSHPAARRTYVLRSRVRCRSCQRRMCGIVRTSARYWADGPGRSYTYYACHHDPANPRHTAPEDHPRSISVREDALLEVIRQFFAQRVFGPDRAALLAADLPASVADDQARRDKQTAALAKRLRQIDAAENAHAREIEALAHLDDPHAAAVTALRSRVLARFTELEDERTQINAELAGLAKTAPQAGEPALLDTLPHLGDRSPRPRPGSSSSFTKRSTSRPCTTRTCTRSPSTSPSPTPPPRFGRHHQRRRQRPPGQPGKPRPPRFFGFGTSPYAGKTNHDHEETGADCGTAAGLPG